LSHFALIIIRVLAIEVSEDIFGVILVSKLFDAGAKLISRNVSWLTELNSQRDALESVRNVHLSGKFCLVATGRNSRGFIRAIVLLQVLFLNVISFQTNATTRAVGERRAEVFSLNEKTKSIHYFLSGPHDFPCCFSPFGEYKIYRILRANKHEREVRSSAFRLG